ncbi:DNA glycosylase [Mycena metata]|uniref:DNA glycosylase n=1 Tax=Mycena metata TaxID=1033252 RepID=A0AAD7HH39_9AGAR|nr:DNA glycosylase [Mycena metata]
MPKASKQTPSGASFSNKRGGTKIGTAVAAAVAGTSARAKQLRGALEVAENSSPDSPFPTIFRPTAVEAQEVYTLLCAAHGIPSAQAAFDEPDVLEGLISTILSQSTSGPNSSRAKARLDATFGRNNFSAIARASPDDLIEAIRCGGLAKKKATTIQTLISAIHERHGSYSLQFLAATREDQRRTDAEITRELLSYKGVGPKTAACVLSLCLGREAFAVDTHVWRLSKVLGWVPESADRVRTQLKHALHVLLMHHGRTCNGCKKDGTADCILRKYRRERSVDS